MLRINTYSTYKQWDQAGKIINLQCNFLFFYLSVEKQNQTYKLFTFDQALN